MSEEKKPTGGPAFPRAAHEGETSLSKAESGMTLRAYFAVQVDVSVYDPVTSFERNHGRSPSVSELATYIASIRIIEADALLARLEVTR